ncbi:MAG: hypothetical protein K2M07_03820 [Muribaculaceae bacterium]|nr:hypothetical protein [Muribaculaceae bacterium]
MNNEKNLFNPEFENIVKMLTPKHTRKIDISFKPKKRTVLTRFLTIGSVAAILILIFTLTLHTSVPVSAKDVINTAITSLAQSASVRVEFTIMASPTTKDGVYNPNPYGKKISGTAYIINHNGENYCQIDWHDTEKKSIIYVDEKYIHLRNGEKVSEHASNVGNQLLSILNLDQLKNNIGDVLTDSELISDNDTIILRHQKHQTAGDIVMEGKFNSNTKELIKASVTFSPTGKPNVTILETTSIKQNVEIPSSSFIFKQTRL